jgi:NCS1 family nucleobase:cation symporter-1
MHSFAIGYIYSFVAAGLFYWILMKFFPHTESQLDRPNTGEDIIAASDEKMLLSGERKSQRSLLQFIRSPRRRESNV